MDYIIGFIVLVVALTVLAALGANAHENERDRQDRADRRRRRVDPRYAILTLKQNIRELEAELATSDPKADHARDKKIARLNRWTQELDAAELDWEEQNQARVSVSQTVNVVSGDQSNVLEEINVPPAIHPPCDYCGCTVRNDAGKCPGCGA